MTVVQNLTCTKIAYQVLFILRLPDGTKTWLHQLRTAGLDIKSQLPNVPSPPLQYAATKVCGTQTGDPGQNQRPNNNTLFLWALTHKDIP
jgi:hypothetical protein